MEIDKLPPHSIEAEQGVLGCVLLSPKDCIGECVERFRDFGKMAFYDLRHQTIYSAVLELNEGQKPIDVITLQQWLKDQNILEQIGGIAYLSQLQDAVPSAANLSYYLEIIQEKFLLRRMISTCTDVVGRVYDYEGNVEALVAAVKSEFAAVLGATSVTLKDKLAARGYSPDSKPIEPQPSFYLGEVGTCTAGNITTISAQAKAGKTAIVGAMLASTLASSERDCLNWKSENPSGRAVIHIDTEQSQYDHWQLIDRARGRANVPVVPAWLQSYCVTGFSFKEIREVIRLTLEQSAQKFGGVHSFILDGAADCVADVNDPAESNDFVAELHALSIQYACPMIGVIHLNPGSDFKTRGHLGSQLERKAETNLKLEMDSNGVTTIWADKNRRAPIPKKTAPRFSWSDEHKMHVSVTGTEQDNESEQVTEQIHEAFRIADKTALHYAEFISALQRVPGIKSEGTAERVYRKAKTLGIIQKNLVKQWIMP